MFAFNNEWIFEIIQNPIEEFESNSYNVNSLKYLVGAKNNL